MTDYLVFAILGAVILVLGELVHYTGIKYKPKEIPMNKWI